MSFSINTNVTSLQAQSYLQKSSMFQAQTINEVTSGLRIVNSGDDAAGLAVANGFRSDEAVLNQGIQNANNGLATLQTIDGGMNNISTLLDRARTLATESASGTFSGNRATLNSEFQSVISEVTRQATAIGMSQGGQFAKALSVFIGGGKGANSAAANANGTIGIDLSNSGVDAKSLGLQGSAAGYQVAAGTTDTGLYDLSSSTTGVSSILANGTNAAVVNANGGTTSFKISGAGFSDAQAQTITVNLSNVTDANSLATAINNGLTAASSAGVSAPVTALKNAGITASIHTGADGHQQLLFSSASNAFQVTAGDIVANAFLGNNVGNGGDGLATGATAVGQAVGASASFVAGGAQEINTAYAAGATATGTINITALDGSGQAQTISLTTVAAGNGATAATAAAAINTKLQASGSAALQGIVATTDSAGTSITFSNTTASSSPFTVNVAAGGTLGFGTAASTTTSTVVGTGNNGDISTLQGATSAVNVLATAVQNLGTAQAAVGKGENNLNYAVALAQSQSTNEAAAESQIRDANLAQQAANLTKAQILVQAGTAALSQANSAPQQLLSLLK